MVLPSNPKIDHVQADKRGCKVSANGEKPSFKLAVHNEEAGLILERTLIEDGKRGGLDVSDLLCSEFRLGKIPDLVYSPALERIG